MTPQAWDDACQALSADDTVMAGLIGQYASTRLRSRGEPYETLLRAIVGQQISVRAADAVWAKLQANLQTHQPESLLRFDAPALRAMGLSMRKAEYARDLAQHFADGRLHGPSLALMDDEAVIDALVTVRGIGRWSAEMFLIFNLQRPDVWPVDDIGLQKAVAQHYLGGERPGLAALRQFGERWRPWRTVACWFLWRSLDPQEVLY